MARAGEEALIARYFAPLAGPGAEGLRDDAASLTPTLGHDLVVTADAVVAGVHYFPDDPPGSIAVKALGVNLSDLAAKGARPRGFLLTLALPDDWTEMWLATFAEGSAPRAVLMAARFSAAIRSAPTVRRSSASPPSARCHRARCCGVRRRRPATGSASAAASATRRSGSPCGSRPILRWGRPTATLCSTDTSTRARGWPLFLPFAATPARPWTCRTDWRATCEKCSPAQA
ncbi:hypothetical protein GCM10025880_02290 [Methylorubrum aminovorans]|nr:hypothetical protein GCM10025880_02290 [Methylorubrum aminovorans]